MPEERDERIANLCKLGIPVSEIAAQENLTPGRVYQIYRAYRGAVVKTPRPHGISRRTAQDIERIIGVKPTEENAHLIAAKLTALLDGTKRLKTMSEINTWLISLGLIRP